MKTGRSVVQAKVPSVGLFCVSFDSVASAVCDVCQKEGRETTSTQSDVTRLQIVRLDLAFVRFLLLVVLSSRTTHNGNKRLPVVSRFLFYVVIVNGRSQLVPSRLPSYI